VNEFYVPLTNVDGSGGVGGGTTTVDPGCVPSNGDTVDDSCGKFVSAAGNDANDGTKDAPFKSLAKAIGVAKGEPVYVCTNGVSEALALTEDATLYGGLDCDQGWKYVGLDTKTPWTASADDVPLIVASGARAKLEDIAITAADATVLGGSSVAMLAQVGAQLTLARCDVSAGDGADGAVGDTPAGAVMSGVDGNPGKAACADMDQLGGASAVLSCDGTPVNSGIGGAGTMSDGGNGSDGKPSDATGKGGIGQIDGNACTPGGDGAVGTAGDAGQGAPMSVGTLGPEGYAGVAGADGKPGLPGQGGGGGGKACGSGGGRARRVGGVRGRQGRQRRTGRQRRWRARRSLDRRRTHGQSAGHRGREHHDGQSRQRRRGRGGHRHGSERARRGDAGPLSEQRQVT